MLIFDIIKKILINIITPPRAGNIRKLVKSPSEINSLESPLLDEGKEEKEEDSNKEQNDE